MTDVEERAAEEKFRAALIEYLQALDMLDSNNIRIMED